MKNAILLFILFCLFFSCQRNSEIHLKIKEAEELIRIEQPDSAFTILEGIANPDVLNDKAFAHFCLIYAGLSEQLKEDMPFVSQMERANTYYEKYGTIEERMNCLLYLGMSYEEEKDFEWAMKSYLQAVEMAKVEKKYLLTGKLYNKIAGLYDFDDNYDEAERYQLLSGEYYLKGNDSVNYIYSLRNIGWLHVLKEEYGEASEYFQNAYRLALPLNDSLLLSSLTNRLGNTYKEMNSYSLAEDYLFKSIAYDEAGSAPTYLALANLFTKKGEYDKAREYIEMAILHKTTDRPLTGGILYRLYMLEKELGNYSLSLDFYERFNHFADSIAELQAKTDVLKAEKRYEYVEVLNENTKLELEYYRFFVGSIFVFLMFVILVAKYKYSLTKKNEKLRNKQMEINNVLQEKEYAVQGLSEKISGIRKSILENSDVYKKMIQNALSIEKAKKNPLTDQEWLALYELLRMAYPFFMDSLQKKFLGLTEAEKRFCCLLKLSFNNQQLAVFLNIQPTSVDRKRYRIRKKGNLENTETTLEEVIAGL
nr:tetratricopeptide repeat protein [Parabacteroides leei]